MSAGPALGAALLVLSLAGCGGDHPLTDQEICDRQAENSPAVKALINKEVGNLSLQFQEQDQRHAAEQDARIACLRSRGLVRPGGVERQKPL